MAEKQCSVCKELKPLTQFYVKKGTKDGLMTFCKTCYKLKRRQSQQNKKNNGICPRCSNTILEGLYLCGECYFKRQVRETRKKMAFENYPDPDLLYEKYQNYPYCAYTGIPLEIGKNLSIDHHIPKSRGGSNDIENLVFVDRQVNYMKGSLLHAEFLELCRIIASRFPVDNDTEFPYTEK